MQRMFLRNIAMLFGLIGLVFFVAGCKKKQPVAPPAPAPAPAPAQPTVTLNASSTSIHKGESATLNWSSTNATDLTLAPGIGKVAPEGSTSVSPAETTTYSITATGPGGSASAEVTINVAAPPPPPAPRAPSIEELFQANVRDAFFDFNKSDIRPDARDAISKTGDFLKSNPQVRVTIEGHCDERGSTEYNLGLGERRAQAAKDYLIALGVSADRMDTVSWGKERPFCSEHNEDCWQQNRRAHFVMAH